MILFLTYLLCGVEGGNALRFLFKGAEEFWILIINNSEINKNYINKNVQTNVKTNIKSL